MKIKLCQNAQSGQKCRELILNQQWRKMTNCWRTTYSAYGENCEGGRGSKSGENDKLIADVEKN